MHLLGPAGKILLTITLSFLGIAFLFSLYSPPVYGQTANAWNIQRITTSNLLDFYYSTGGSTILELNPNGQSGIRSIVDLDNPSYFLDPNGTSNVFKLQITNNNESTTLTNFTQALTSAGIHIQTEYTASAYTPGLFWSTSNNQATKPKGGIWLLEDGGGTDMYFGTSNNYATGITNNGLVLDQAGNVGIGTTGPGEKLDVNGSVNTLAVVGAASYKIGTWGIVGSSFPTALFGGITGSQWSSIGLYTSGSEKVRIDTNGNVGIGTTAPTQKLDVAGNINANGLNLPANGSIINMPEVSNWNGSAYAYASYSGFNGNGNGLMSDGVPYYWGIGREPGIWGGTYGGSTYPDLVINNHTGLRLAAHSGYGGVSIFEESNPAQTVYSSAGQQIARFKADPWGGTAINGITLQGGNVTGGVFSGSQFNATGRVETDEWLRVNGGGGVHWNTYNVGLQGTTNYVQTYPNGKGLHTPGNGGIHSGSNLLNWPGYGTGLVQASEAFVFPGSVYGLGSWQRSYYLASDSRVGLYTNTGLYGSGFYSAGPVLTSYNITTGGYGMNMGNAYGWPGLTSSSHMFFDVADGYSYYFYSAGYMKALIRNDGQFWLAGCQCYINQTSDARLKKDARPIEDPLDKISKLEGVYYYFDKTRNPKLTEGYPDTRQMGFLAQQIQPVVPEVINSSKDGILSVDYAKLTALLTEGIKKQQNQISSLKDQQLELKKENQDLKEQNNQLKSQIDQIRQDIEALKRK